MVGDDRGVLRRLILGLSAGVAAGPLGLCCGLNELCAKRAHLLTRGRTHVEGAHHRTETSRRGNGLEAGNTSTEHKGLGGGDAPRCRGQHRQELIERTGANQHRLVASHAALRGEHVHGLRAADARYQFECEGGEAALFQRWDQIFVRARGQEGNEGGAFRE